MRVCVTHRLAFDRPLGPDIVARQTRGVGVESGKPGQPPVNLSPWRGFSSNLLFIIIAIKALTHGGPRRMAFGEMENGSHSIKKQ